MFNFDNIDYEKLRVALEKKAASEVPSKKSYEKDSTYKEDGEGKFPMRPNVPKDAIDALRLKHHAPPDKQKAVEDRACKMLKKEDPEAYKRNCE